MGVLESGLAGFGITRSGPEFLRDDSPAIYIALLLDPSKNPTRKQHQLEMSGNTVVITGATGQLGRQCLKTFSAAKWNVVGTGITTLCTS